jgi:hypothetical protein
MGTHFGGLKFLLTFAMKIHSCVKVQWSGCDLYVLVGSLRKPALGQTRKILNMLYIEPITSCLFYVQQYTYMNLVVSIYIRAFPGSRPANFFQNFTNTTKRQLSRLLNLIVVFSRELTDFLYKIQKKEPYHRFPEMPEPLGPVLWQILRPFPCT